MKKIDNFYSTRRYMRAMLIIVIYEYELLNEKVNLNKIFEDDKFNELFDYSKLKTKHTNEISKEQFTIISVIEKNYDTFKKMISKYIRNDWTWTRINPLSRSILLCASAELWKEDIGLISNEYIELTKDFIPDDETYKFINVIIQKIGEEYEYFKKQKNIKN